MFFERLHTRPNGWLVFFLELDVQKECFSEYSFPFMCLPMIETCSYNKNHPVRVRFRKINGVKMKRVQSLWRIYGFYCASERCELQHTIFLPFADEFPGGAAHNNHYYHRKKSARTRRRTRARLEYRKTRLDSGQKLHNLVQSMFEIEPPL